MVRITEKEYGRDGHYWADGIADYLINQYPQRDTFTCASGISPSGRIHFGNFREVVTTYAVVEALQQRGKKARFIYSWDDFDRFRKVPKGVVGYEEHIGKALSAVPSLTDPEKSYATVYEQEFEDALRTFHIRPSYRYQTELYQSGTYDDAIVEALRKREAIADILLSFMTEKGKREKGIVDATYRKTYFPITLYSRFSGKDATTILSYDGEKTVTYRCNSTKKEESINLSEHRIAKLSWKVDWAMRWRHEGVCFEPGGSDHAAPEGSYAVSAALAKKVFGIEPPVFTEYGFVGLQGVKTKMSGSSGQTVSPNDLLTVYEPSTLLWMYLRRLPTQTFSLALDTEVYRQYDERDTNLSHRKWWETLFNRPTQEPSHRRIATVLRTLLPNESYRKPIPFRHIVGLAQTVLWDEKKLHELLNATNTAYDTPSITSRLHRAKTWVTTYTKEAAFSVRETPNTAVWNEMDEENKQYVQHIRTYINDEGTEDIDTLETFLYSLPKKHHPGGKALKKAQHTLFSHVYQLLLGQAKGPRLSTLLWATPKEKLLLLLGFT